MKIRIKFKFFISSFGNKKKFVSFDNLNTIINIYIYIYI